jgi:FkbM family methyltransferase
VGAQPRPDSALVRFLLDTRHVRFFGTRVVRTYRSTTREGMRLMFHTRDRGERGTMAEIVKNHVYERFPIQKGSTVVDVGANIGIFTILASRLVGDRGAVVAVEPTPSSFRLMKRNISLNGCVNVKTVMAALGEKESVGMLNMYQRNIVNSFFSRDKTDGTAKHSARVQIKTLDGLTNELGLNGLDFLKIDTEGYEVPILKGGIETIRRFRPFIIGEAHFLISDTGSKIAEFLSGMGYRCQVEPKHVDTEMFYADPSTRG